MLQVHPNIQYKQGHTGKIHAYNEHTCIQWTYTYAIKCEKCMQWKNVTIYNKEMLHIMHDSRYTELWKFYVYRTIFIQTEDCFTHKSSYSFYVTWQVCQVWHWRPQQNTRILETGHATGVPHNAYKTSLDIQSEHTNWNHRKVHATNINYMHMERS